MKVSIITLAAVLALSNTMAMAQSDGNSLDEMAASSATRSAMNSMHSRHHHHHGWSASRYNGHGINSLGVTTNQGRKNNGG
jgi:Ni/Co efflux regulator RcnB